jgi:hypothetical protein
VDVARLLAEGSSLIRAIVAEFDLEPLEVLKACSMVPGRSGDRPRYLVALESASPEWLARTVHDLREMQRSERLKRAPTDTDGYAAAAREHEAFLERGRANREAMARKAPTCAAS